MVRWPGRWPSPCSHSSHTSASPAPMCRHPAPSAAWSRARRRCVQGTQTKGPSPRSSNLGSWRDHLHHARRYESSRRRRRTQTPGGLAEFLEKEKDRPSRAGPALAQLKDPSSVSPYGEEIVPVDSVQEDTVLFRPLVSL